MIRSKLHIIMHEKGYRSVAKLAEDCGVSRPTLYRLHNDTGDRIEYGTLNTLCTFFNCALSDLLEYVPDLE
jgi:putative transcriptional regulator